MLKGTVMGIALDVKTPEEWDKMRPELDAIFATMRRLSALRKPISIAEPELLEVPDEPPVAPKTVKRRPPPYPLKTKVGHAMDVLKKAGHGLTTEELAEGMVKAGWVSQSATPTARNHAVRIAIGQAKDIFARRDGKWILRTWLDAQAVMDVENEG